MITTSKAVIEYSHGPEGGLKLGKDAIIKHSPVANWRNVGKVLRLNPCNGCFETQSAVYINYNKIKQLALEGLFLQKAIEAHPQAKQAIRAHYAEKVGVPHENVRSKG